MTPRAAPPQVRPSAASRWHRLAHARATAVAAIWGCAAVTAVLAPPLVSGPEHHHLPVAAVTTWWWAAAATAFLARAGRSRLPSRTVATVVQAWLAAAFLAVSAPPVVTDASSTAIPVMAVVAPIVACLVTGYAVMAALIPSRSRRLDLSPVRHAAAGRRP